MNATMMLLGEWLGFLWPNAAAEQRSRWHRADTVVAVLLVGIALAYARGLWMGDLPYMDLDGDSAQVASYCAALDHPQFFAGDPMLANPHNYDFYATIQLPLARGVTKLLTGDYGTAFLLPAPFLLLLQGLGYYRLGKVLYRSRIIALGLSLSTFLVYTLWNLGDYWGTRACITPRDWFQSVLPLLLAYHLEHRREPRTWVISHFLLGLLIYVHPPSTPTWALALWAGTWFLHPDRFTFLDRVRWMVLCAAAFFAAAIPFAVNYLYSFQHGVTDSYDLVYMITKSRYLPGYLNIPAAFRSYWTLVSEQGFVWGALAGVALVWFASKRDRPQLYAVMAWLLSLWLISFTFPYQEQEYAREHRIMPVEVDFVRSCRYTIMLLHVLCLWPLTLLARRSLRRLSLGPASIRVEWLKQAFLFVVVCALLDRQSERTPPTPELVRGFHELREGRILESRKSERAKLLDAVRDRTPPGSKVMVTDYLLASAVRYYAFRQVAWSYKDGGVFAYSNHAALIDWNDEKRRMDQVGSLRSGPKEVYLDALFTEARRLHAGYAIVRRMTREEAASLEVRVVYSDRNDTLVML
jgi:hypothetical protein